MYPSNSNGSCDDPIAYSDHSFFHHGHFATETIQDEDPNSLSLFNFPSPYYSQCELDDVFLPYNQTLMPDSVSDTVINMTDSSKNVECCAEMSQDAAGIEILLKQLPPRKRSSSSSLKRDRHSKINTANGLRDRRMRLSLDVAREFFGLQDMLGFDKASRTVEWLLIQSRQEIRKLARARVSNTNSSLVTTTATAKSPSSTSEGEVVSALGQPNMMIEKKGTRQAPNPLARDLREKARERAKARTKAKKLCSETMNNPSLLQATVAEVKHLSSRDTEHIKVHHGDMIDEPLPIINKWSPNPNPNPVFNCLQNSGIINQEHQLTGFLSFGKPWEAYN